MRPGHRRTEASLARAGPTCDGPPLAGRGHHEIRNGPLERPDGYSWVLCSRVVRNVQDSHERAAHTVSINEGSRYVTYSPQAYDLFLTAAAGGQ